jgi:hypothetical protein
VLGLALSVLNLAGAFLALLALGGLGAWSGRQFIGMFGLIESATGLAYVIGPNIWRLPVAEANTSDRTAVRVAASTILLPHWAALSKVFAGAAMLLYAADGEGVGLVTVGLLPVALALAVAVVALSLLAARLGATRPDIDVLFVTVRRPGHRARALPGISISGMVIQLIVNIGTFPAVKLLSPTVLYRPALGPSPGLLVTSMALATALTLAAAWAWRGRIAWHAPREQQREAEQLA